MATPQEPPRALVHPPAAEAWKAPSEREVLTPEHVRAVLELARALSSAAERAELATIAAERVRISSGASATQVAELHGVDSLAVLAQSTTASAADRRTAFGAPRAPAPAREVIRSGAPVWLGSRRDARERFRDTPVESLTGSSRGAAWAFLPLAADDELVGVLTLVFDDARDFDLRTRVFLVELASECANALARGSVFTHQRERAEASEAARAAGEARLRRSERLVGHRTRLFERERFARARAEADTALAVRYADDVERAQQLTRALAHAETEWDVIGALARQGPDAFGGAGVSLLLDATDEELHVVASAGPSAAIARVGSRVRSDGRSAEAEVFRTGTSSWEDGREGPRRLPLGWEKLAPAERGSWLGVPVRDGGAVRGVLGVAFAPDRTLTAEDRARLALLAEECACVWSERAARDAEEAAPLMVAADGDTHPAVAHVAQYEAQGPDGPEAHVLGVFSSEAAARDAVQELRAQRTAVARAWITSWVMDVPRQRTRVEPRWGE